MPSSYEESLSYKKEFIKFDKLLYCICIHVCSCLCVYNETSENGNKAKHIYILTLYLTLQFQDHI